MKPRVVMKYPARGLSNTLVPIHLPDNTNTPRQAKPMRPQYFTVRTVALLTASMLPRA